MTRRIMILGFSGLLALLLGGTGFGQYNIPPTRVPQTAEPGLADPKGLPQTLPSDLQRLGNQPQPRPAAVRSAAAEEILRPASDDPPVPAVALRVRAPGHVAAGSPIEYTITVENISKSSAHHVTVTNPINPANVRYDGGAEPAPSEQTATLLRWKLGTLAPGVSRKIKLKLTPTGDGEFANIARVTFEHGQQVTTTIDKPRVVLKREAPKYAHDNDRIPVKLIVENTGKAEVTNLVVKDVLEDGLKHEDEKQERLWTLESLRPGEKRELKYTVTATKQGAFTANATVKETRFGTDQQAGWTMTIGKPLLDAKITGPAKTYLTQPAEYLITVRNDGNVPLDNVSVAVTLPPAIKVARASQDAQTFKDRVQWGITRFEPKATKTYRLSLQSSAPGKVPIIVQVLARGTSAQSSVETEYEGATALRLRVHESSNRVQEGEKITYTVSVQNTGTIEAKDLYVEFDLPQLLVKLDPSSEGALLRPDKKLIWGKLTVRPGATTTMTVTATTLRSGMMYFHATLNASKADLPSGPLTQQAQTVIEPK